MPKRVQPESDEEYGSSNSAEDGSAGEPSTSKRKKVSTVSNSNLTYVFE
jgi:hypothetical protein